MRRGINRIRHEVREEGEDKSRTWFTPQFNYELRITNYELKQWKHR